MSINKLDDEYGTDLGGSFKLYEDNIKNGFIHSLYAKISDNEYSKLFKDYSEITNICKNKFYLYNNNSCGFIVFTNEQKSYLENWKYVRPSKVYCYEDVSVAYTIDEVTDRSIVQPHLLNMVDCRLSAYGHWFSFDQKKIILLGTRLLTKNDNGDPIYISIIKYNDRKKLDLANVWYDYATYQSCGHILDKVYDNFIMFRTISSERCIYNERLIANTFTDQNLSHLVGCYSENLVL